MRGRLDLPNARSVTGRTLTSPGQCPHLTPEAAWKIYLSRPARSRAAPPGGAGHVTRCDDQSPVLLKNAPKNPSVLGINPRSRWRPFELPRLLAGLPTAGTPTLAVHALPSLRYRFPETPEGASMAALKTILVARDFIGAPASLRQSTVQEGLPG
jgi:hypothetical protein